MTTYTRFVATAIVALTVGCGGSDKTALVTAPDTTDSVIPSSPEELNGAWTRVGLVPGSSERWNLAVVDSVVTGDGQWSGEACCSGPITIRGVFVDKTMHLEIKLFDQNSPTTGAPRFVERVDAGLHTITDLVGTVAIDSLPAAKAHWRKGTNPF